MLLSGLLVVAAAQPVAGATTSVATVLFVAPAAHGGNDTHPCTQPALCLTVQHAVDVSTPGGRIHVGAGTFVGRVNLTGSSVTIVGPVSTGLCPSTDQRHVSRPPGSACDIGAVEREAPLGAIVAVSFQACTSLHVVYNRFTNGAVAWQPCRTRFGD